MDQITPAQLAERLQQPEHPALLDVREPDEHGIVALPGGAVLVASQDGHLVYRVPAQGKATIVAKDIPIPAAIGLDTKRNRLLVPQIVSSNLTFVDLP